MKKSEVIQALEEGVARNLTTANAVQRAADEDRAVGLTQVALEAEGTVAHCRYQAGLGIATVNHINGVSPE